MRRVSVSKTLNEFWTGDVLTVNELLESTGLTRATVHSVCNELVERGWIRELDRTPAENHKHGRPAKHFQLDSRSGFLLGLDLSEERLSAVVADPSGRPVLERQFSLPDIRQPKRRRKRLGSLVEEILQEAGLDRRCLLVAAIGAAAPVSRDGRVGLGGPDSSPNYLWSNIGLDVDLLRSCLGDVTVLLANDANLALLAERWQGLARGVDDVVVLLGTEELVGTAIMDGGHTLSGHGGGAGEIYWVEPFENVNSIARRATDLALKAAVSDPEWPQSVLAEGDPERLTHDMILDAVDAGDACAGRIFDHIAVGLARTIRTMAVMLNPELVVLAGTAPRWRDAIVPVVVEIIAADVYDPPRIRSSTLGDAVVTIGALRLALDHLHANAIDIRIRRRA